MPSDESWFDEDEKGDEFHDDEYPGDESDDDATDTATCPHCGAEVYEDTVRCPVCENYITPASGSVLSGRPLWWIVLGLAGVVAVLIVLAGFPSC
jgi:hypothetical protein